jgi:fatty-acid desaturase
MSHESEIVPNPERPVDLAVGGAEAAVLSMPGVGLLEQPFVAPKRAATPVHTIKPAGARASVWQTRFPDGVDWPVTLWMIGMHIGAIVAFWFFSWPAFVTFLALHFVTACLGITLGFHRLLTHGSLAVPRPLMYFFSMCGMLSAEGSPMMWVANHRKHHALSDEEGDPHSPNDGFFWSHMFWFSPKVPHDKAVAHFKRWAPDLYKDPGQRFMDKIFPLFSPSVGLVLYGVGEYFFQQGWSFVMWGLCARMVVCYHCTWFVNSATHVWGYRNYHTSDRSRNLWWVALLTYGEGWHNNHHAHQRLARHGHRKHEIDVTYMVIWTLKKVGLAWDVQDKLPTNSNVAVE